MKCRLGIHRWRLWRSGPITLRDGTTVIAQERSCWDCGKTQIKRIYVD